MSSRIVTTTFLCDLLQSLFLIGRLHLSGYKGRVVGKCGHQKGQMLQWDWSMCLNVDTILGLKDYSLEAYIIN